MSETVKIKEVHLVTGVTIACLVSKIEIVTRKGLKYNLTRLRISDDEYYDLHPAHIVCERVYELPADTQDITLGILN